MFYLLRLAANIYITHYVIDRLYPEQYRNVLFFFTCKMIYLYSFLQFHAKKYLEEHEQVKQLVDTTFELFTKKPAEIECIVFNNITLKMSKNELLKWVTTENEYRIPFDFVIYSFKPDEKKNNFNRCMCYDLKIKDLEHALNNRENCDFTFLSVYVVLQLEKGITKNYVLKLKTDTENYYMVGNKINSLFVCHYLYQNYGVDYDCEHIVYSMNIVDHNVTVVSLTEKDCLVFSKEKYTTETVIYDAYENDGESLDEDVDETVDEDVDDEMPELEEIDQMNDFHKEIEELKMEMNEMIKNEISEPFVEPLVEVVTEPLVEVVVESVVEPVVESVVEPVVEPVVESIYVSDSSESYEIVEETSEKE